MVERDDVKFEIAAPTTTTTLRRSQHNETDYRDFVCGGAECCKRRRGRGGDHDEADWSSSSPLMSLYFAPISDGVSVRCPLSYVKLETSLPTGTCARARKRPRAATPPRSAATGKPPLGATGSSALAFQASPRYSLGAARMATRFRADIVFMSKTFRSPMSSSTNSGTDASSVSSCASRTTLLRAATPTCGGRRATTRGSSSAGSARSSIAFNLNFF
mmetsp:Transcript_22301/g.68640  ORF Transcript_22301/g.68640 Transcript_22301/m.68640 type:complete len:217 (+) Transcript_22301:104-754(+)